MGVTKRRMTAGERKRAIVEAAMPLFARKGYAETTTKDLALAAGVSEPLLYKHFPSKEALYHEIQAFSCHDNDPVTQKLAGLEPSASTLVHLVYYLMRAVVLGKPVGAVEWETRHRLMLKSLLEDGVFARLVYESRFACFCARMEECLDAAIRAGEAVKSPLTPGNRARFGYHVGAWLALVHLPAKPAINYKVSREKLLDQCVWFILRGMGLTDRALALHYNPRALDLFFQT
jgi:TetR/AcrR family transcriptional regulator, transcriptional repressor of aconitase